MSQDTVVKRQFGHRARLALSPAEVLRTDGQAHAARTMWNLLHAWWQMMPKEKRTLGHADAAVRQARKDIDFLAVLPAQAAQAVLKTYFQAWKNCWEGRADAPNFKGRFRTVMSVDVPQGRDLNIVRVHRRWGMVNLPKVGRVRFRWTKDLPVGKRAGAENRITGARLVKDALGWHIAFRVQSVEVKPEPHQGPDVGIDVGITVPIARTYGTVVVEALTITNMVKSARGTIEEPGKNVAQKSGLNRSISGEAWGRTVTMLTYKTARLGGTLHKVPAPGTSQRCSACGFTTPGNRESQAVFVCKNPDCGWSGNADHNAARNVLHLYRMGLALIPAAGRAVVRRAKRVKPAAAR
ncbi:RNA-guided endonuclease InsQ/TnpB family protein [Streptomyces sp. NBC_00057]|uniref:RNA-guided endonuclease InsQ/TnpB family protein n=1 Tax=Streptomyces sp. NBC_00057 TaxID=2975634 RepID=UPI00324FB6B1